MPARQSSAEPRVLSTSPYRVYGMSQSYFTRKLTGYLDYKSEILRPWFRVVGAHLATHPFLLGGRPSLADFALFGGNAAHFINDPLCRRWVDADAPAIVVHTHRLMEPQDALFCDWMALGEAPETMISILAELDRHYLPWISRAAVEGKAELAFADAQHVEIAITPFLAEARATLLGRYVRYRSDALDALLARAGILSYFADYIDGAGQLPDYKEPPRPALNRLFGPSWEREQCTAPPSASAAIR